MASRPHAVARARTHSNSPPYSPVAPGCVHPDGCATTACTRRSGHLTCDPAPGPASSVRPHPQTKPRGARASAPPLSWDVRAHVQTWGPALLLGNRWHARNQSRPGGIPSRGLAEAPPLRQQYTPRPAPEPDGPPRVKSLGRSQALQRRLPSSIRPDPTSVVRSPSRLPRLCVPAPPPHPWVPGALQNLERPTVTPAQCQNATLR